MLVCERLGLQYSGHLPFVSDRVGEIAKDWCPAWMPVDIVTRGIIDYIKRDIEGWPKKVSHAVVISGHGGNNFLKDEEDNLSQEIGIPFHYTLPFAECSAEHTKYGKIEVEHANPGEHSVAAYMGVLDKEALDEINMTAAQNPEEALRKWPPLCGLGGYILLGGPRYEALRNPDWGLERHGRKFLEEKYILGDYEVGKALFNQNLDNTIKDIREFIGKA